VSLSESPEIPAAKLGACPGSKIGIQKHVPAPAPNTGTPISRIQDKELKRVANVPPILKTSGQYCTPANPKNRAKKVP
jgi:hypothetical protein